MNKPYLLLLSLAFCACSRPQSTPPQTTLERPSPPPGLRDPDSVSDPVEQQRIRDQNTRQYTHWNYQPAERKSY
jgi:hypothetical protein